MTVKLLTHLLGNNRARRHKEALTVSAAIAGDLAAVVLGSGGSVPDVVETLAFVGPANIQPSFKGALARVNTGELWAESLTIELSALGAPFHPLAGALAMADSGGASIGSILQHLSDDARQARRVDSERRSKKLSVQLILPLTLALLPAVVLGAVVPIVVVALGSIEVAP